MREWCAVVSLVVLASCGGGDPAAPAPAAPTPPATVARVELSTVPDRLESGDTVRITATPRSTAGTALTGRVVSWSAADASIALVSSTGLVTAVAPGATTITATVEGASASLPITVIPPAVASIAITPSPASVIVGGTQPLTAALRDKAGRALAGRAVTWRSADAALATVSASGVVTGVAVGGPLSITASSEGREASVLLTVRPVPVAQVAIRAPATDVDAPASLQLSAVAADSAGNVLTGRAITWSSETPEVAVVDPTGVFRTLRAGTARVRARVENVDALVTITVRGLLHRWAFTEEGSAGTVFRDDISGQSASIVRVGSLGATAVAGQVRLTGGPQGNADYVELPRGLLRTQTDATIEVWATLHSLKSWSRLFDIGGGITSNLFIAWSQGVTPGTDRTAFTVGGVENRLDNTLAPFTIDLQHHVVMAIDEGGGAGGRTRVSVYLDGALRGSFETTYRLRDLADDRIMLGRSFYPDETANASYDEVRIHNRVYAPTDVARAFRDGPVRTSSATSLAILPPAGMRDTVRGIGVRFGLRAVARDALGRQFQVSGIRWSSTSGAVATVDSTGTVEARAAGRAEITATTGTLTARWGADVLRVRRLPVDPYLATPITNAVWEVPVVIVEYHPTADGASLDVNKAPDFYVLGPISLDSLQQTTLAIAQRRKMMVEQGSRFRGYANPLARPSLGYRVVEHIIVYDQMPPHPTKRHRTIPGNPRYEDWFTVFADLQLEPLMRSRRVRELWVTWAAFDGDFPSYDRTRHKVDDMRVGWESNMVSATGDVSNSDRDPNDAPILPQTYIIYGINFRRSQAEAVHNVGHQLEAMFGYIAARQDGTDRLFWRDFVGQDAARNFVTGRAGWTHMPPNTTDVYDYLNTRAVSSDIEDWRADNGGAKKSVNVNTWGSLTYPWPGAADFGQRIESQWYTYWFQNMPGLSNRIPFGARFMTNWWAFVADWDAAIASGLGLHASTPAAITGEGVPLPVGPTVLRAMSDIEREPPRRVPTAPLRTPTR